MSLHHTNQLTHPITHFRTFPINSPFNPPINPPSNPSDHPIHLFVTYLSQVSAKEAESKDFAKAVGQSVAVALGLNQDDVSVTEVEVEKGGVEVTYVIADKYDLTAKEVDQALSDDATAQAMDQLLASKGYKHMSASTGHHAITTDKVKATSTPSSAPTYKATQKPSHKPSDKPTHKPTHPSPTHKPSHKPTFHPTMRPIEDPNNNNDDFPAPLPKKNKSG